MLEHPHHARRRRRVLPRRGLVQQEGARPRCELLGERDAAALPAGDAAVALAADAVVLRAPRAGRKVGGED